MFTSENAQTVELLIGFVFVAICYVLNKFTNWQPAVEPVADNLRALAKGHFILAFVLLLSTILAAFASAYTPGELYHPDLRMLLFALAVFTAFDNFVEALNMSSRREKLLESELLERAKVLERAKASK